MKKIVVNPLLDKAAVKLSVPQNAVSTINDRASTYQSYFKLIERKTPAAGYIEQVNGYGKLAYAQVSAYSGV